MNSSENTRGGLGAGARTAQVQAPPCYESLFYEQDIHPAMFDPDLKEIKALDGSPLPSPAGLIEALKHLLLHSDASKKTLSALLNDVVECYFDVFKHCYPQFMPARTRDCVGAIVESHYRECSKLLWLKKEVMLSRRIADGLKNRFTDRLRETEKHEQSKQNNGKAARNSKKRAHDGEIVEETYVYEQGQEIHHGEGVLIPEYFVVKHESPTNHSNSQF